MKSQVLMSKKDHLRNAEKFVYFFIILNITSFSGYKTYHLRNDKGYGFFERHKYLFREVILLLMKIGLKRIIV
jgi:hypothetical protein